MVPTSSHRKDTPMIIFDFRFGRFSIIAQRETVGHTFKVTREGTGEVVFDLPWVSVTFTNHQKAEVV